MASPDTVMLLIVDHHAAIGGGGRSPAVVLHWSRVYCSFKKYFVLFFLLLTAVYILCSLWAAGSDGSGFPPLIFLACVYLLRRISYGK